MNRILLALSLSLLAFAAYADSSRATDDAQMNCPKPGGKSVAANATAVAPVAPQNYVAAVGHGSQGNHAHTAVPRMVSPRWHTFLPGMFR